MGNDLHGIMREVYKFKFVGVSLILLHITFVNELSTSWFMMVWPRLSETETTKCIYCVLSYLYGLIVLTNGLLIFHLFLLSGHSHPWRFNKISSVSNSSWFTNSQGGKGFFFFFFLLKKKLGSFNIFKSL